MKITTRFPLVVLHDTHDDLFAQKKAFMSAFQFDPQEVAEQRNAVDRELELVFFVCLSDHQAYFYSPLFVGKYLNTDDEEVCFAYFDYKQEEYSEFPGQYYSAKDFKAHTKNNSLPAHMPWEALEQRLSDKMNGPYIERHFARWLALQQHKTLTAEIKSNPTKKSTTRKI